MRVEGQYITFLFGGIKTDSIRFARGPKTCRLLRNRNEMRQFSRRRIVDAIPMFSKLYSQTEDSIALITMMMPQMALTSVPASIAMSYAMCHPKLLKGSSIASFSKLL